MGADLDGLIERAAGSRPLGYTPLGGGCVADVKRVALADGRELVAKLGGQGSGLGLEGEMLVYLATHSRLPVPEVLYADDGLLLMSCLDAGGGLEGPVQVHAAELVADLHGECGKKFGFENPTVIGGLPQPNPWAESWLEFFRDQRLLYMSGEALKVGRLPSKTMARLETLAGRLDRWIHDDCQPSLVHGDMWTGNVLSDGRKITGFVDPAIYYADPEIELAFSTMFGTFGDVFFSRYNDIRLLRPGFFEERRDLYNLYPLLVHVRLFGGHYVGSVERTLSQFGV